MKDQYMTAEKATDYATASKVALKYAQDNHLSLEHTMVIHRFIEWCRDEIVEYYDEVAKQSNLERSEK